MSDVVATNQSGGGATEVSATAGMMLRKAREASGLHVAALAVSMKVPVKKLEALEADKLDLLMDAVFVRALASSVCRTLKIDPAPVLARLPQNVLPKLHSAEGGINEPFHVHGQTTKLSLPAFLTKPAVLVVSLLLLGVIVLAFFPEIQFRDHGSDSEAIAKQVSSEPKTLEKTMAESVEIVPPTVAASAPITPDTNSAQAVVVPLLPASDPGKQPVVSNAVASTVSSIKPESLANVPQLVLFRATAASWLEVTDAKGVVQIRRTLSPGETVGASGVLPLAVVVGRVDAVQVDVRGKPFSLAGIAKDNVARFEVK